MNWHNIFSGDFTELNEEEIKFISSLENEDTSLLEVLCDPNPEDFINLLNIIPIKFHPLLKKIINRNNINLFEVSEQSSIKNISYEFYSEIEPKLKGILNLRDNKITLEDKTINSSLNTKTTQINEETLELINTAIDLNLSEVPVVIELSNKIMVTKEPTSKIIDSAILISSLFFSLSAFGEEYPEFNSEDMLSNTVDAIKEVDIVKEYISEKKQIVDKRVKEFVNSIENKEVAGAVGLATKIAIEQKIGHKGKLDTSQLGLSELGKLDYSVEVNVDGTIKGGIEGNNPFIKNSSYRFLAETGNETKIKFDLKINFD